MPGDIVLELKGITKSYGETQALRGVDLQLRKGEVLALIGENGAGKSTLMKVLDGIVQADEGQILLQGVPARVHSPLQARKLGVAMIHQELTLAPHLSVEENATLGLEESSLGLVRSQRDRVRETLKLLGHPDLDLGTPVSSLGIGLQQVVEIARALLSNASILIMDEPTSSLTSADTQALFSAIRRLKEQGLSIIYISHFLEEVKEISDSYMVLRDGERAGGGAMASAAVADLIRLMVGRPLDEMFPKPPRAIGEQLFHTAAVVGQAKPQGVSFRLRRGEILGIAGLVGSGRSETLRCLFGLDPAKGGTVNLSDARSLALERMTPSRALDLGLDHLSEDRKGEGLAVGMSLGENVTLSSLRRFASLGGLGLLDLCGERQKASAWIEELRIKTQGPDQTIGHLSGGNQQKAALARLLQRGNDVLLLDEPTRGVDVGSKVEIYRLIQGLAAKGKGIIFVSSYLPELLGVCDTLAVMHRGRLSAVKPVSEWDQDEIMAVATSGKI